MYLNLDNICLEQFSKTYKKTLDNCNHDDLKKIKTAIEFYLNNLVICNQQQINSSISATHTQSQVTILHIISKFGDALQLKKLLPLLNNEQLNAVDRDNFNAIHHAVLGGNLDNIKLLHESGTNINCISNDLTRNLHPIHFASKFNMLEIVNFFLQQKIDIEQNTFFGLTPLHIACEYGNYEMVKFLLIKSANLHATTNDENHYLTPLHYATIHNHPNIIEFLIQHKANIDIFDNSNNDILYFATKFNHPNLIKLFLNSGAGDMKKAKDIAVEYNLDSCLEVIDNYLELQKILFDTNQIVLLAQPLFFELKKVNQENAKTIILTLQNYNFGLGFLKNIFTYTGLFKTEKINFINFLQNHDLEFLANKLIQTLEFLKS
jgi:ankyrin repeat protein